MAGEVNKDEILQSDRQQWSVSNKIEAEGLEWMYSDPNAAENKEKESEQYLLGKSIPGARGEFGKIDALQGDKPGSLLNDGIGNKTYDDTVNLLREDPLFVIKKIEAQQQQIADKYDNILREYGNSRPLPSTSGASEPGGSPDDYASEGDSSAGLSNKRISNRKRSKYNLNSYSNSCCTSSNSSRYTSRSRSRATCKGSNSVQYEENNHNDYSPRSDSVDSNYGHKKRRHKKPLDHRKGKPNNTSKNTRNGNESSKDEIGPQLPLKTDPLASAFAVPDPIKAQRKTMPDIEYPHVEKRRKRKHDDESYWSHSARMEKIEMMRLQGVNHLQRRLHGIVADELEKAEMKRYENYYKEYSQPKTYKAHEDKYERARKAREAARIRAEQHRHANNF